MLDRTPIRDTEASPTDEAARVPSRLAVQDAKPDVAPPQGLFAQLPRLPAMVRVPVPLLIVGVGLVGLLAFELITVVGTIVIVGLLAAVIAVLSPRPILVPMVGQAPPATPSQLVSGPLPAGALPAGTLAARDPAPIAAPSLSAEVPAPSPVVVDRGQAVLRAVPDAALIIDGAGVILDLNTRVTEYFPRARPGMLVNQMCRSPEVVRIVERALATGSDQAAIDEWVPVRRRLLATASLLVVENAFPPIVEPGLLIVFRDVSDQERLAQMRADFIANASHELRTPLASLRGFVETLQGPAREDPVARDRFLAIMASQANRMTRLIDDLLSLSRVEMRLHVPPTATVDLADVLNFVVQSMEPLITANRATVTVTNPNEPLRVRGDREELVQVVQNLVHNALKYGRTEGSQIAVRLVRRSGGAADTEPGRITLEVEDDGPGIAPEHISRLTERFYRVSPTVSRDRGGTGLGLAIVKNIVNRHRGELAIRSTVGTGSIFAITFDEVAPSRANARKHI